MPSTITLSEYLFARLKQLGIESVHGVPGDYNLTLLDYVVPSGLFWVGSANELNAGYAADGYARITGIGALITTFGVGELSAINAIAGAFTERAAVVHIVGTPAREWQQKRHMIHHTLGDGDYRHFGTMAKHVTVAQTNLWDTDTAQAEIDRVLQQCLIHSRPVYIEFPMDMVSVQVPSNRLDSKVTLPEAIQDSNFDKTLEKVLDRIHAAKQPVIIVDGETRSLGITESVQKIVSSTKWPTFTTAFGKGLVDMTQPNVYGIFRGKYDEEEVIKYVQESDLVLCFGPHFSSTNTYRWTSVPKAEVTIQFAPSGVQIGDAPMTYVPVRQIVTQLADKLDSSSLTTSASPPLNIRRDTSLTFSAVSKDDTLKQDKFWKVVAQFMRPGDVIMGETGTSGYGVREFPMPPHSRLFAPITWLSIGYMLPAAQGAALAQRDLAAAGRYHGIANPRTVLFIGDGSFQMTVQELGTIIRHGLNVVVFLVNNDGYTIERAIHGLDQKYNDIATWDYMKAPGMFGASADAVVGSCKTYGDLEEVLKNPQLADGQGLRMVEIFLPRDDTPPGILMEMMNVQKMAALAPK